jgi:ribose transport system substrate-binding protein
MKEFAEAAAAELSNDKYTIEIVSSAPPLEDGVNEQITMFESYLESGVDGVLIVPCGTAEVVDTIKKANEKDVPVICLDTNADEGAEVAAFIGTNNYDGGYLAGEWTVKNVSGQVAIITGTLGNQCHTDRTNGYLDGLGDAENIELVGDVQPCNGDQGTAMGITENLLTAYPDLRCIYVTSDTGAMGAATAVQAAGRDVKVIGFDGSPDGAQSILDGGMTATVAQTPGIMAEEGVKALYELIVNGTASEDQYTACTMVTAENAEDYLTWH